jgi:DNA-binding transcriptional LysR family regulator
MSLARFRYFEKVARLGSIRQAADALHIAPSAISRQIGNLEHEFGAELFEREGRGMRLTPAGQILARHVRGLLEDLDHARSALDDLTGLRRGHVRVWSVEGMVRDFVTAALADFRARYPAVTLEVTVAGTDEILAALLDDEADVGVAFNPLPHRGIATVAQIADPLFAVARPDHPAAAESLLSLADLLRWPMAVADRAFGLRHLLDAAAKAAKVEIDPAFVTNSIEALRGFARSGMGTTILPRLSIERDIAAGLLAAVPLRDRALGVARVKICTRAGRRLPAAADELARDFGRVARQLRIAASNPGG